MKSNTDVISVIGVSKHFKTDFWKKKVAVDNLTLSVPQGEVMGLLGPNGSGKSTTIKMILGFLKPTAGEILVGKYPASQKAARAQIGYLPENPRFQKFLTGNDILHYYGKLLGLRGEELKKRADYLLDLVGLKQRGAGNERVGGYSKGMTQRLAIAQSLLNKPTLLIFDEPMSGLDPLGRMEIRKLIQTVHDEMADTTIFFSTHILEDVEALCTTVALLRQGKLKTFCRIDELMLREKQRYQILVRDLKDSEKAKLIREKDGKVTPLGISFQVDGNDMLVEYLTKMKADGARVLGVQSHRKSLEEALFTDRPSDLIPTQEGEAR